MKNGISAYLVAYHEEKVIERCLKSLVGAVDEIIVIHDGPCRDNTIKIAQKYTKNVYEGERRGMTELHRIDALQKCYFPWVLQMDADEFLSEELRKALSSLTQEDDINAYGFLWKIWNGKEYLTNSFPFKTVLFRKEQMGYIACPHKNPFVRGTTKNIPLPLEHQPSFNNYTLRIFQKKWRPWIKVHATFLTNGDFPAFQTSSKELEVFQKKQWRIRKYAHPILAPVWFCYAFLKSLSAGFYKNPKVWHIPILQGMYGFFLCLEIWKNRRN
ncbi:glycosyltransferase [Candidatus Peregrinibacteria bacterium]|nr:MAG: glycosyltransferase [Candidatus Peregrinibacteria bacterium]